MFTTPQPVPLTRRLVGKYLAFGLACLLLCLAISLTLTYRGALPSLVSLAALAPIAVLVVGAYTLYRTTRLNSAIEAELLRVSESPSTDSLAARPLVGDEPAVAGWNAILDRLATQDSLAALEQRLSTAIDDHREQRLRAILDSLSDGIAYVDDQGAIGLANRAMATLAGVTSPEELIGRNLLNALRVNEGSNAEEVLASLRSSSGAIVSRLNRGRALEDGVLRISRQPFSDSRSGKGSSIWTVRDVTQWEVIDAARNDFVASATHELRTPLANIKAYAETLSIHEDIDVEKQKEFCNIINSEVSRLARLVDDVLNVSQMEAGSMTLDCREADLKRIVQDVIEHVRPQMTQKDITFEAKLPPKYPEVKLDRERFQAALVNLLGNACKYTPAGGQVTFNIELRPTSIEFHVEDTGIGIASEELSRVFDKFFRSADERVADISGNGLGLTFTQQVLRLHGGRVSVESEPDAGSHFIATLPLK